MKERIYPPDEPFNKFSNILNTSLELKGKLNIFFII